MTYKELVDSIKDAVDAHMILRDFGYGALTDIKTVDEGTRVNYPYAFLNPTQSTRTGQSITYRFNLIVMDVVQEDPTNGFANYLKVQSACQQYVDDILAALRFGTPPYDFDLTLNVNLTPFKERFQDTLAGMTATLEIEIPFALNLCEAPIRGREIVEYGFDDNQIVEPDPIGTVIGTKRPAYDPQDLWNSCYYTGIFVPTGTYLLEVTGRAKATESKPIPPAPKSGPTKVDVVQCQPAGSLGRRDPDEITGWPEGQVTTEEFTWTATYEISISTLQPDEEVALLWSLRGDADPADESQMEFIETNIKIYEL